MGEALSSRLKNTFRFLDFQDDRKKAIHVFLFLTGLFLLLTAFVLILPKSWMDLELSCLLYTSRCV